ncbi:MAG: siderophore biosynthesis protein SbnG [Actinobacteria bacterium]|nr:MAG: siderophore biosynthesis protein SbnG [Actinomycetota bacterium]
MSTPGSDVAEAASVGLFCSLVSPAIVEMIGWAGFDFVILDAEHSLVGPEELAHQLRAADAVGLRALVRIPSATSSLAGPVLDAGAAGVVIPRVRSASDVEAAVRAARYHPWGRRGLDAGRATRNGQAELRQAVRQAARDVAVVAMIEDREGVDAIADIVGVPGLDAVLEGAADLSQSMGTPWETTSPVVQSALEQVETACRAANVPFWAVPRQPPDAHRWRERGVRTFVTGDARNLAARALEEHCERARERIRA